MAKEVWVVVQHRDGKIHKMSLEAIAAGQRLAAATGGAASAVILGQGIGELASELSAYDLAAVLAADGEAFADYSPGAYVGALAPAIAAAAPAYVVFPHTYQSVDYFPRLGQEVGAAVIPEVISFAMADVGFRLVPSIHAASVAEPFRGLKGERNKGA